MSNLLSRLRLTQKLALLALLVLIMVAVPAYNDLSGDLDGWHYAEGTLVGLPSLGALRKSTHLTQVHRGQTAGALAGNAPMAETRRQTRQDLDAAMADAATALGGVGSAEIAQRAAALRQRWQQLAADVDNGRISGPQSFEQHSALVTEQIDLGELLANATGLSLFPDADGYHLQLAMVSKLEPMIESLGMLRALGTAALQKKDLSPQDFGRVRALAAGLNHQIRSNDLTLNAALDALRKAENPGRPRSRLPSRRRIRRCRPPRSSSTAPCRHPARSVAAATTTSSPSRLRSKARSP